MLHRGYWDGFAPKVVTKYPNVRMKRTIREAPGQLGASHNVKRADDRRERCRLTCGWAGHKIRRNARYSSTLRANDFPLSRPRKAWRRWHGCRLQS